MSSLVIVESPAKASTINKYLGKDFKVVASFGHIRDLPSKNGSVKPEEDFSMLYELNEKSARHVNKIIDEAKKCDTVYLASDPDREGESIAWHVLEVLKQKKLLPKLSVKRVSFNEITKSSVLDAIAHPRDVDMNLVNAQQARRALDYLVGFTLSPLLWRKLPGSRSAGRVQSVALRLISERDDEIDDFVTREYWNITGEMLSVKNQKFASKLVIFDQKKLDKFDIANKERAEEVKAELLKHNYKVLEVEKKKVQKNPYPPFTTSTLQQEASRKLGFSTKKTMMIAQGLYEGVNIDGETSGLITYMRTDGTQMSEEALASIRDFISKTFGKDYLPDKARIYKTKAKNAQEAHEAIRPTDINKRPENIKQFLNNDQYRLYELIWKRALACQMENALYDQVQITTGSLDENHQFRTTGSTLVFDGFRKLYIEKMEDKNEDEAEEESLIPPMNKGEEVILNDVKPTQHFTEPPPRYTEASLVKKMEELGIGRPSTYSSIISVLQDRKYVRLDGKRFFTEDRGRVVTAFLVNYFKKYVEYDFTAGLENELDEVSSGKMDWKKLLHTFWNEFDNTISGASKISNKEILDKINEILAKHLFKNPEDQICPSCKKGTLGIKTGRYGIFIACSSYPECNFTEKLDDITNNGEEGQEGMEEKKEALQDISLGTDSETGKEIYLKKGPYGLYLQLGTAAKGEKPPRFGIPTYMNHENITLPQAEILLRLPKLIGMHPETGKNIEVSYGKFSPYIAYDGKYFTLDKNENIFALTLEKALAATKGETKEKSLGKSKDGEDILIKSGRYGPYIKCGKKNYALGKINIDDLTLEKALEIIEAKA